MAGAIERIKRTFAHQQPDRTSLFEIFQPYHPIYWEICGRNIGTDAAMAWDAKSEGVRWEELIEAEAVTQFKICKFFGLDMVRLNSPSCGRDYFRPVRIGKEEWLLNGVKYHLNERTKLVEVANPTEEHAYSHRISEKELRKKIESWYGKPAFVPEECSIFRRVQELADQEGIEWIYMGEIGAGTGAVFYPPFLLVWMLEEPELYLRYLEMEKVPAFVRTKRMIEQGCSVIAIGGDVSCDKGPFISPRLYREFILPVIQEHVELIHEAGALAVYTSDGNHWPIKEDFFFNSGIDGYKEVDKAAGMTWERLIEEGIDQRICIIGNIDARYTMCQGTKEEVRREVLECLTFGQKSPGGHILHTIHSVHEDVKIDNYYALVEAYRDFFGMEKLV